MIRIRSRRRGRGAHQGRRLAARLAVPVIVAAAAVLVPAAAYADPAGPVVLAADSIEAVVNNIRTWMVGILVAVATSDQGRSTRSSGRSPWATRAASAITSPTRSS